MAKILRDTVVLSLKGGVRQIKRDETQENEETAKILSLSRCLVAVRRSGVRCVCRPVCCKSCLLETHTSVCCRQYV